MIAGAFMEMELSIDHFSPALLMELIALTRFYVNQVALKRQRLIFPQGFDIEIKDVETAQGKGDGPIELLGKEADHPFFDHVDILRSVSKRNT